MKAGGTADDGRSSTVATCCRGVEAEPEGAGIGATVKVELRPSRRGATRGWASPVGVERSLMSPAIQEGNIAERRKRRRLAAEFKWELLAARTGRRRGPARTSSSP